MKIIVCLDDRDGMLFHGRRQSTDRMLRRNMLDLAGNSTLRMNRYSRNQFTEDIPQIEESDDFLAEAEENDYCFVEDRDISPYASKVNTVIIYRWNRVYPSDMKFPTELFEGRWRLTARKEFAGSSHERITEEIYML